MATFSQPAGRATPRRLELTDLALLAGCVAYLLLKPIYLFPSGGPQLADAVVAGLAVLLLLRGAVRLHPAAADVGLFAGLFVFYVVLVNFAWAMWLSDLSMVKAPVFYFYNFMMLMIWLQLDREYGSLFARCVVYAILGATLLQVLASPFVVNNDMQRQTVFFNNPNQLAYWVVLAGSLLFVYSLRVHIPLGMKIAFAGGLIYLAALSLSKAGIIATAPMLGLAFARSRRQTIAALALGGLLFLVASGTTLFEQVAWRIGNIGEQSDDNIVSRGYARIWTYPEHLLLGAGEGRFDRFGAWTVKELHSSLATVLFSYGIPGFALFCLMLWHVCRGASPYAAAFLVPPFLFGLAHQGMRSSLLWVLFAAVASSRRGEADSIESRERAGSADEGTDRSRRPT